MTTALLFAGAALMLVVMIVLLCLPTHPSMAEEERELRAYFRRKDAAEARGERYPD